MNYSDFKRLLIDELNSCMPPTYRAELGTVNKNNDTEYDAIFIKNGTNIAPTYYPEDLYKSFCSGTSIDQLVGMIKHQSINVKPPEAIFTTDLLDYKMIKDQLCFRLINKKLNHSALRDRPFFDFLDLAVTVQLIFSNPENGEYSSVVITNPLLKKWNISKDELFLSAATNTLSLLPPKLCKLKDMFNDPRYSNFVFPDDLDLYVLTNTYNTYGATSFIYPHILDAIAEKMSGSYFIIPSSVHELIILPAGSFDGESITSFIKEVNKEISPIEILSDHVYYYDFDNHNIKY